MNEPAPLLRIAWLFAVWKFNARIKRAFTAKSQEAVPAHRTNTNIWTVVTHSTIPTDGSCPIAVTEERSQAQVPAESKNRCRSMNQALPSIAVGDHTGLAFMFWCPPAYRQAGNTAITVFWCAETPQYLYIHTKGGNRLILLLLIWFDLMHPNLTILPSY